MPCPTQKPLPNQSKLLVAQVKKMKALLLIGDEHVTRSIFASWLAVLRKSFS
jgi:hypothetical protein